MLLISAIPTVLEAPPVPNGGDIALQPGMCSTDQSNSEMINHSKTQSLLLLVLKAPAQLPVPQGPTPEEANRVTPVASGKNDTSVTSFHTSLFLVADIAQSNILAGKRRRAQPTSAKGRFNKK